MRYEVGLKPGIASVVTERNPGMPAVVDMETPFGFGVVVAICDNQAIAERIAALLNAAEVNKEGT